MTQSIETLVERLRGLDTSHVLKLEAAAALESQAARIAELEAQLAPQPMPDREEGVSEIVGKYALMINKEPRLISLLYDIDMLPEQCRTYAGALRLAGLCEVWKERTTFEARLREIGPENDRLRAALAVSKDPCVYCSLPADKMAECQYGFPGCARADDSMGCPELGASLERDMLRSRLREAEEVIRPLAVLEVPKRSQGNAGAYSIRPGDIERARRWLDASEPTAVLNVEKGE